MPDLPVFFDTHAHLDYPDFAPDLESVIDRAAQAGITRIITIGTDLESSRRAVALAGRFEAVYAVVGWHPCNAAEAPVDFRSVLREVAAQPKVVALGETGLDYHRLPGEARGSPEEDLPFKQRQLELFRQHLEVAAELNLNCVIHQRAALEDTLREMEKVSTAVRGVFHCFAEDAATQKRIERIGSRVSFTGIVTFKNGQKVRETVAAAPLGGFMLETDCPYLAPVPHRGRRCEPAYVKEIGAVIADVKGVTQQELSEATCAAARSFFRGLN